MPAMDDGPVRMLHREDASRPKFCSELEAANLPIVLVGGAEHWPAIMLWDPRNGGLSHLKRLAGSTIVQAITSDFGSAFYGHVKGHERVAVSFESFINSIVSGPRGAIEGDSASKNSKINKSRFSPGGVSAVEKVKVLDSCRGSKGEQDSNAGEVNLQLYLAQVPIFSRTGDEESTLTSLMQDIEMPLFLTNDRVSDINLWMSMGDARSSTHYDPYHNLLCVVTGEKRVTLWPPSATPFLYPLPINGEASNHSGVDFVQPDYNAHPLFEKALSMAKHVTLHPGDTLFIPEGWWHQVDNTGITIAVNFWWPSKVSLTLGTHMDAYFLRRVVASLVDHEKEEMLRRETKKWVQQALSETENRNTATNKNFLGRHLESMSGYRTENENLLLADTSVKSRYKSSTNAVDARGGCIQGKALQGSEEKGKKSILNSVSPSVDHCGRNLQSRGIKPASHSEDRNYEQSQIGSAAEHHQNVQPKTEFTLEDLTALETHRLECVMTCLWTNVSDLPDHGSNASVNGKKRKDSDSLGCSDTHLETLKRKAEMPASSHEDMIAGVFSASTARSLQRILLVMANQFPVTLQNLILTRLSPCAAETLTRKFEEMDSVNESNAQSEFYQQFYGAFDDSKAVMDALVDGKEAFAAEALHHVMTQYLGLACCPSK